MNAPAAGVEMKAPLAFASGNPWVVLRLAIVVAGYLTLVVFGLFQLANADALGVAYAAGGVVGLAFLPRRGVTTAVWVALGIDGAARLLAGDAWRGVEIVAGAGGAALTLLPWRQEGAPLATEAAAGHKPAVGPSPAGSRPFVVREPSVAGLTIRTIGAVEVWVDGDDVARAMVDKPVIRYLFLYLLARAIDSSGRPVRRSVAADELNPGLPEAAQKDRLRKRLSDLQKLLPERLRAVIKAERTELRLDLSDGSVDVWQLADAADAARAAERPDDDLLARLEDAYRRWGSGEFIPGWDDLEAEQAGGRGEAGALISSVRRRVEGWRADVVVALARAYGARREPQRSIPLLEQAHRELPEREDVAEHLAAAYLITGQASRAGQIRRAYQLGEA